MSLDHRGSLLIPITFSSDISAVHKIQLFVNVIEDGLDELVLFHILADVHSTHYVLLSLPIIDRYVFARFIDLVLDVCLLLQSVQHVRTVVNVYRIMNILNPIDVDISLN